MPVSARGADDRGKTVKRTTRKSRTLVTGYEIDVDAVATAMLRDQPTRQLLFTRRISEGAHSREGRSGDRPR
jgi:hypothetical protein